MPEVVVVKIKNIEADGLEKSDGLVLINLNLMKRN